MIVETGGFNNVKYLLYTITVILVSSLTEVSNNLGLCTIVVLCFSVLSVGGPKAFDDGSSF